MLENPGYCNHIVLYQNHARLKLMTKLLVLLCTDDILSNIATTWSRL